MKFEYQHNSFSKLKKTLARVKKKMKIQIQYFIMN